MAQRRVSATAGVFLLGAAALTVSAAWTGRASLASATAPQSVAIAPAADAYVAQPAPNSTFGSASQLIVASSPIYHAYLLFNVSGLTGTVMDARLVLHATTGGANFALRSATTNTWNEATIDYANAPSFGVVVSRESTSFQAGATISISAASIVQGNGTYTLVLTSPSTAEIGFASRESGSALSPQLVITEYAQPSPSPTPSASVSGGPSRIQHIVIFFQENHSFDNVLGALCTAGTRATACDGASSGLLEDGSSIPLSQPPDIVPNGDYNTTAQNRDIDGGRMDGFGSNPSCNAPAYSCYSAYEPSQIPNLASLATKFAISDRTFELNPVPSWSGHMELADATLDGFTGLNPQYYPNQSPPPPPQGPAWGCDSNKDAPWAPSLSSTPTLAPSCIPDYSLDPSSYPYGGAYRATPVQHVDTIMDRLDAAGLTWKLYTNNEIWAICPTFADCMDTTQRQNMLAPNQIISDAQQGSLPSFSVLLPSGGASGSSSQHNGTSMAAGDNWIGQVLSAIENGPDWASTAVFITYDDNGGFYDHVPPPAPGLGIRVPMVIVSPYARAGYTDSNVATFASLLAFTEHTFGLPPLNATDSAAYDYSSAFDYSQTPLTGSPLSHTAISLEEQRYLAMHPSDADGGT